MPRIEVQYRTSPSATLRTFDVAARLGTTAGTSASDIAERVCLSSDHFVDGHSCILAAAAKRVAFSFHAIGNVEYEILSWSLEVPTADQVALRRIDSLESSPRVRGTDGSER